MKRGRKRKTITECPGAQDAMQCLHCPYEDCMLHDHLVVKGGVCQAVENALAGSWDCDDRNQRRDIPDEQRRRENATTKRRRTANLQELADKQACIREARLRRGMTQKEAAKLLGVSGSTLSMWETGRERARWDRLHRFFPELSEPDGKEET